MLLPLIRMSPESNEISRLTSLSAVVFPPPDGPTRTQKVPAGISSESSSSAWPPRPGYVFETRSKTRSAARDTVPDPGQADEAAGGDQARGDRHRQPVARQVEAVFRAGDCRADDGDPDETGNARDRVVDARGDAGVALTRVCEHRRRQRRDDQRKPDREDEQRRQELGPVVEPGSELADPDDAAGTD